MQMGTQIKRISRRALWWPSDKIVGSSQICSIHAESWHQNQRTWMCLFQGRSLPLAGNSLICRIFEVISMNLTNNGKDLLYEKWKITSTLALAICHVKLWSRPWHLGAGEPFSSCPEQPSNISKKSSCLTSAGVVLFQLVYWSQMGCE